MSKRQTQGSCLRLQFKSDKARQAYRKMISQVNAVSDSHVRMGAQLKRRRLTGVQSNA